MNCIVENYYLKEEPGTIALGSTVQFIPPKKGKIVEFMSRENKVGAIVAFEDKTLDFISLQYIRITE